MTNHDTNRPHDDIARTLAELNLASDHAGDMAEEIARGDALLTAADDVSMPADLNDRITAAVHDRLMSRRRQRRLRLAAAAVLMIAAALFVALNISTTGQPADPVAVTTPVAVDSDIDESYNTLDAVEDELLIDDLYNETADNMALTELALWWGPEPVSSPPSGRKLSNPEMG